MKFSVAEERSELRMIAEKLNAAISDSGMKQRFIAEKIGISEQALSAMVNGKQKIDVDTFFAIAKTIQKTPDEIYSYQTGA